MKKCLIEYEPGLAEEIFLDLDAHTGIRPGERWKQALQRANSRCEAVICLLSKHWEASHECETEFRYAETLNKTILCALLEPLPDTGITSEWQRCDLFPGDGPTTEIEVDGGKPVLLATDGVRRLLAGLRTLGIGAGHFAWPPQGDPERAPYRGWAPLEEADAAVFFGRDAQILRGLDALHGMRSTGVESLFVVLGPSGAGKSSFLRAGLLPRLRRDDRRFLPLPIVRPERAVLTGDLGLAKAIHQLRTDLGFRGPVPGEIKNACHREHVEQLWGWLEEARQEARARLLDVPAEQRPPTLVLPVDQAEELFNADAGPEAARFLELLAALVQHETGVTRAMVAAVTIRADRYEPLQTAPQLAGVHTNGSTATSAPTATSRRPSTSRWAEWPGWSRPRSTNCSPVIPLSAKRSSTSSMMRSSRGWPPSTHTTTSRCAAWPAGMTCPPPAAASSSRLSKSG